MIEFYLDIPREKCKLHCDNESYVDLLTANIGFITGTYEHIIRHNKQLAERFKYDIQNLVSDSSTVWTEYKGDK